MSRQPESSTQGNKSKQLLGNTLKQQAAYQKKKKAESDKRAAAAAKKAAQNYSTKTYNVGGRPASDRPDKYNKKATVANTRPKPKPKPAPKKAVTSGSRVPSTGSAAAASAGGIVPSASFSNPSLNTGTSALNDFLKRASNAASIEYDPKINELIRQQNAAASTQKESDKKLADMYSALNNSMLAGAKTEGANYDKAIASNQQMYNQLGTDITGQFNKSQQGLSDMLQKMGIQSAGPEALGKLSDTALRLQGLAKAGGQALTDAEKIQKSGAVTRMNEFGAAARAEGATRRADLMDLLQQRLGEYGGQIVDLRGAKGKMISELSDKYRDEDFSKQMALAGLQLDQSKFEAGNQQWAAEFGLKSQQAQLDAAAQAAKAAGVGTAATKTSAWGNLAVLADDIVKKQQSPRDPARQKDYLSLLKRAFDSGGTLDDLQAKGAAGFANFARSLNSKAEAKKGGYHQVNSDFLNNLAMDAWQRIVGRADYQYGS